VPELKQSTRIGAGYQNWSRVPELEPAVRIGAGCHTLDGLLGMEHPHTLISVTNLTRVLCSHGKYEA